MNSKIFVATHKQYIFPDSNLYEPLHVGKALSPDDFGYRGDDNGINISEKNVNFCELTGLYWAWKNKAFEQYDYCGLVHYRRYFTGTLPFNGCTIISDQEIQNYLSTADIILPKKRKYYIETIENHYANAHNKEDLDILKEVLSDKYPEYLSAYTTLMQQRELYLYNMFITKKELFSEYIQWLFDILFEVEKRVNIAQYDTYQSRIFGFLSERLLNVWLIKNQLNIKEVAIQNIEGENLIMKAIGLLHRKFLS